MTKPFKEETFNGELHPSSCSGAADWPGVLPASLLSSRGRTAPEELHTSRRAPARVGASESKEKGHSTPAGAFGPGEKGLSKHSFRGALYHHPLVTNPSQSRTKALPRGCSVSAEELLDPRTDMEVERYCLSSQFVASEPVPPQKMGCWGEDEGAEPGVPAINIPNTKAFNVPSFPTPKSPPCGCCVESAEASTCQPGFLCDSASPGRDPGTLRCVRVRRDKFKRTASDVSQHTSPTSVLTWDGDILPRSPQREEGASEIRGRPLSLLSLPLPSLYINNAGSPFALAQALGPRRLSLDSQELRVASPMRRVKTGGTTGQGSLVRRTSLDRFTSARMCSNWAGQPCSSSGPESAFVQGEQSMVAQASSKPNNSGDGMIWTGWRDADDFATEDGGNMGSCVFQPGEQIVTKEDMQEDCAMMERAFSSPALRVPRPLTPDQPAGGHSTDVSFRRASTFSVALSTDCSIQEPCQGAQAAPFLQRPLTERTSAGSALLPVHPLPSKLDPNHVLSSQLSPTLTALLEVISGGAHVEAETAASKELVTEGGGLKHSLQGSGGPMVPRGQRRHARAPRIHSSLATLLEELTCEPESPGSSRGSATVSRSKSEEQGIGEVFDGNEDDNAGQREQSAATLADCSANATRNSLRTILAAAPDEEGRDGGLPLIRSITSAGDTDEPNRSKPQVPCVMDSFALSPQGLQRQSSLDSGIDINRGKQSPDLSSLHASPACDFSRRNSVQSPEHDTPSPVLHRRLTGHRVTVVGDCWQAGAQRQSDDEGTFGMRSVLDILEQEGAASFYRGFSVASPQHESLKRTKIR